MQVSVEDEPPISLKYSTSGLISSATIWSTALSKHVRAQYFCLLPRKSFTLILYMVLSVPGRAIYHTNVLLAIGQRWVVFCQVFPDSMFLTTLICFPPLLVGCLQGTRGAVKTAERGWQVNSFDFMADNTITWHWPIFILLKYRIWKGLLWHI